LVWFALVVVGELFALLSAVSVLCFVMFGVCVWAAAHLGPVFARYCVAVGCLIEVSALDPLRRWAFVHRRVDGEMRWLWVSFVAVEAIWVVAGRAHYGVGPGELQRVGFVGLPFSAVGAFGVKPVLIVEGQVRVGLKFPFFDYSCERGLTGEVFVVVAHAVVCDERHGLALLLIVGAFGAA
jgi:hypothetical protein